MGARFEVLDEGVLMAPLDTRYTQVGFNSISVQVCMGVLVGLASISGLKKAVKKFCGAATHGHVFGKKL